MPRREVALAVDARLAAFWTETPVIDFDTQTQPPDNAPAFLVVQYPVVNGAHPVLGRLFWEEGALRLVLNVLRGIGRDQALIWCNKLTDMFRVVKFDGVETFMPDGPQDDDASDDGNWVSYSIIVPYRFEYESAVFEFESA